MAVNKENSVKSWCARAFLPSAFVILTLVIFFKNAWLSEDAFIIFRSIEQLFAGNGPVWNPHERVQVYTSPLWYWLLASFRCFSSNPWFYGIAPSAILLVATVLVIFRHEKSRLIASAVVIALMASNSFFDYTSAGLENCLGYFLFALLFYNVLHFSKNLSNTPWKCIKFCAICMGLLLTVRHDMVTLIWPLFLGILWALYFSEKRRYVPYYIAVVILPITLWSIFSVVYYGKLLPNSVLAKINTGANIKDLMLQGVYYWRAIFFNDVLTGGVIVLGVVVGLLDNNVWLRVFAVGILSNALCSVLVGGDYMQGRFLNYSYLLALLTVAQWVNSGMLYASRDYSWRVLFISKCVMLMTILGYVVCYSRTPLNSPFRPRVDAQKVMTSFVKNYFVIDARWSAVAGNMNFMGYLDRGDSYVNPTDYSVTEATGFRVGPDDYAIRADIGQFGYAVGIEKTIVDPLAIGDPFLSQFPAAYQWRAGHFFRVIPEGYVESLKSGKNVLVDHGLSPLFDAVNLATRDPHLFSKARIKAIFRLNTGVFSYEIHHYMAGLPLDKKLSWAFYDVYPRNEGDPL